jgi:hypothetical protein
MDREVAPVEAGGGSQFVLVRLISPAVSTKGRPMVLLDLQGLTVQAETLGVQHAEPSGLSLLLCNDFTITD